MASSSSSLVVCSASRSAAPGRCYRTRRRALHALPSRFGVCALVLLFVVGGASSCGPGRGAGFRRGSRKMTPLVFKQHVPNVSEHTLGASGLSEGRIARSDPRFKDLVVNNNPEIMFKDEEGTGADRRMSQRCRDKLNILSASVINQWPGVRLRVIEAWDEDSVHATDSLHYEGRAVDITTSDRDRAKYGMLARLAVEAGFDWVYFESRGHIHCSVKSDSSIAVRTGGCFPSTSTVQLESGAVVRMSEISVGDRLLTIDARGKPRYDDVIAFVHRDPSLLATFVSIATDNGRRLAVTADHLVYAGDDVNATTSSSWVASDVVMTTRFAGELRPGDVVAVADGDRRNFRVATVTEVSTSVGRGVFAPLTSVGSVVVDGVAASCYASFGDQRMAHASMAPLRVAASVRRWWRDVGLAAAAAAAADRPRSLTGDGDDGVHWYADGLRWLALRMLPSEYWYRK